MKLVSDHGRCFGDVTLGETRMTASTVWGYGGDVDAFMRDFPDESREAVEWCMGLVEFVNWPD